MITVDVPREWLLNANQRMHWRTKAKLTKYVRTRAFVNAMGKGPFDRRVRCTVDVSWPDKRRRDVHNLMPTIKACIDGFVDAGILADDSDKWLVGPDLRVSETLCDKRYACSLVFTFEEA